MGSVARWRSPSPVEQRNGAELSAAVDDECSARAKSELRILLGMSAYIGKHQKVSAISSNVRGLSNRRLVRAA